MIGILIVDAHPLLREGIAALFLLVIASLRFRNTRYRPRFFWNRVSDRSRNTQIHLRTGSRLAPDFEMSADLLSALAHTLQAPVSLPSHCRNVGIDSRSIVANSQPQLTACVCDLCVNAGRLGVPESVLQSFAHCASHQLSGPGRAVPPLERRSPEPIRW